MLLKKAPLPQNSVGLEKDEVARLEIWILVDNCIVKTGKEIYLVRRR